ncbi:Canalicular multispecific organic anion transporter 1 [Balamuthia mandrillaris]
MNKEKESEEVSGWVVLMWAFHFLCMSVRRGGTEFNQQERRCGQYRSKAGDEPQRSKAHRKWLCSERDLGSNEQQLFQIKTADIRPNIRGYTLGGATALDQTFNVTPYSVSEYSLLPCVREPQQDNCCPNTCSRFRAEEVLQWNEPSPVASSWPQCYKKNPGRGNQPAAAAAAAAAGNINKVNNAHPFPDFFSAPSSPGSRVSFVARALSSPRTTLHYNHCTGLPLSSCHYPLRQAQDAPTDNRHLVVATLVSDDDEDEDATLLSTITATSTTLLNNEPYHQLPSRQPALQQRGARKAQQPRSRSSAQKQLLLPPASVLNPDSSASLTPNVFSRLTFHWLAPLLSLGNQRALEKEDLVNTLPMCHTVNPVYLRFARAWEQERAKHKEASLWWVLIRLFWKRELLVILLDFLFVSMIFLNAFCLQGLIECLTEGRGLKEGLAWTLGLFLASLTKTLANQQQNKEAELLGLDAKTSVSAAVYRKNLRLNGQSKGEVMTLMSTDATKFRSLARQLNFLFTSPVTITLILVKLFFMLGVSALAGVAVMILFLPINVVTMYNFTHLQDHMMRYSEKRVKIISEILQGMLAVKFFAWEYIMKRRVEKVRKKELQKVKVWNYSLAAMGALITTASTLLSLSTFAVHALRGKSLEPSIAFPAIYLFGVALWPLLHIPWSVSGLASAITSVRRLRAFLLLEELEAVSSFASPVSAGIKIKALESDQYAIFVEDGTFQWKQSAPTADQEIEAQSKETHTIRPCLHDLSFGIDQGELVAIVGEVGAGKSSLLSSILGETQRVKGHIAVCGTIAYVSQQAWIRNATLRDNILFGQPMDEDRYQQTLQACALLPDLAMLPAGDQTEIGERGVNLSGGQKQRINFARAVYANKDIYLLDDPLSAVDAHVGKIIFEQCLKGDLMEGKTIILVTHQLQYLPAVDRIFIIDKGTIKIEGTFEELQQQGVHFASLCGDSEEPRETLSNEDEGAENLVTIQSNEASPLPKESRENGKLIEDEERFTGTVDLGVYKAYICYGAPPLFLVLLLCLFMIAQGFDIGSKIWLAFWTSSAKEGNGESTGIQWTYLGPFLGLGLGFSLLSLLRGFAWFHTVYRTSIVLHSKMLWSLLRAPMSFFHHTPQGRILNRFSKDQNVIDQMLPDRMCDYVVCTMETLGSLVLVTISMPIFLLFGIPIIVLYYYIQKYYRNSSRELTRLDSITSSPVFAHFSESVEGSSVIRAYRMQESLIAENEAFLDANNTTTFLSSLCGCWMGVRVECTGSLVVLCTSLIAILSQHWGVPIDASLVGLALSYSVGVMGALNWMVVTGAVTEAEMSRVERVLHYCQLPTEAPLSLECGHVHSANEPTEQPSDETDDENVALLQPHMKAEGGEPRTSWPSSGSIVFQNVTMSYNTSKEDQQETSRPVLRDITFSIRDKEKIGICGRTGAGKSSLIMALFRIVEVSQGAIFIDGVDIATLGLHVLRSNLSIIPQDPVLFSGNVRRNLDPSGRQPDSELWRSLERVNLKAYVANLPGKLDSKIEENGQNWSVGQRQLLCMARALLVDSKVLIMDEATASIDPATDAIIQQTVREAFADRTVLTIAHRLPTIIDMDRIMVLEEGRLLEFDTPASLLATEDSAFTSLVNATGSSTANFLRRMALDSTS